MVILSSRVFRHFTPISLQRARVSRRQGFATATRIAMDSIKVHNSLKPGPPVLFAPIEKGKISWYACGPTVYDHSHLGHARNYVSTDIIRRILLHYYGFDVKFVMNFTGKAPVESLNLSAPDHAPIGMRRRLIFFPSLCADVDDKVCPNKIDDAAP